MSLSRSLRNRFRPSKSHTDPASSPSPPDAGDPERSRRRRRKTILFAAVILLAAAGLAALGYATSARWQPLLAHWTSSVPGLSADEHDHAEDTHADDEHAGHDHAAEEPAGGTILEQHSDDEHAEDEHGEGEHGEGEHGDAEAADEDHPGHDDAASLALSEQGRRNVGLTLITVQPRDFERTMSIPGLIVERPARTLLNVAAPLTGIVTRIYPIRGEAVRPGDPLFDLRLTHEDLVEKQSQLLRALEELDVVKREVARVTEVTASGVVAGKALLERQYEQQKIEAQVRAERQALQLHGLSEEQIERIVTDRQLLQQLTVVAPAPADHNDVGQHEDFLQVREVAVNQGDQIAAGTPLATLSDHCELYVEGRAFEQDADELNRVAAEKAEITALVQANGSGKREVKGLNILYVDNDVQTDSRALRFYVLLPNELVRNDTTPDGHRFIGWRYRPGQRVELLVPVERWEDRIVLPVQAVIDEGAESFVYQQIAGHFDRKAVHVEYRDPRWAVIANDGALAPGDRVAAAGAYQIHLALKNKAGGGPDPHAGHNH